MVFTPTSTAITGQSITGEVTSTPTRFCFVAFGSSNTDMPGIGALPLDLTLAGMTGCTLYQSADVFGLPTVGARVAFQMNFSAAVPSNPLLVGLHFYFQAFCADCDGFSLHAGVRVAAGDRRRVEHLLRYAGRPAIAESRLSLLPDGCGCYELKRRWKGGTTNVVMPPEVLIERLLALVPRPRRHLVTYHGVLAPASGLRSRVVPRWDEAEETGGEADAPSSAEGECRAQALEQLRRRRRLVPEARAPPGDAEWWGA